MEQITVMSPFWKLKISFLGAQDIRMCAFFILSLIQPNISTHQRLPFDKPRNIHCYPFLSNIKALCVCLPALLGT